MRRQQIGWLLLTVLGLAGCLAGRGQSDLLQARLREQAGELANAQSKLADQQRELTRAHRESEELRRQLAQSSSSGILPEQSDLLVRVSGIKINSMLTAGVDRDEIAGDDALFVQFAPYDADGELVKLPGAIDIAVLDPSVPENERTVATWAFNAEQSREHWTRGLLGTGYQFTLPWPHDPPRNAELVVHVRLKPVDGREFMASHVFRVTPPVIAANNRQTARKPVDRTAPQTPPLTRAPIVESTNWTEGNMPVRR